MRGWTGLIPAIGCLVLFLLLTAASPTRAQELDENVFFTLEQGDFSITLTPLREAQSVADFYNYSNFQSNTGLEVLDRSYIFLYRNANTGELSLVMFHSRGNGGSGSVTFDFSGLPQGVEFLVQDDQNGRDLWSLTPPTGQIRWTWDAGFNDGGAIGPLPRSFEITVTPQFLSGVSEWATLSGDVRNPETQILPSLTQPVVIRAREGVPPRPDFTANPRSPGVGVPVTFDAKASRPAPGQEITRYEWDFDGDGIFEVSSASATVQHTFREVGVFDVTLRITDDRGVSATVTKTLEVVEVSVRADRSISTPEAIVGHTFRVTVEIRLDVPINGLGMDEDLPPGFEVTPIDNAGATFKRADTQWVWTEMIQAGEIRRVVYDITVTSDAVIGPLPDQVELDGFIESASPAFASNISGESEIRLVNCLSVPVAVAHLTPEGVVDLRLNESIEADQVQRAVSFWLEEAGVPGTCDAQITWEMIKGVVARRLADVPVDEPLPGEPSNDARVSRTILTTLPFGQVYLPDGRGRTFRVRLDVEAQSDLAGFGIKEIFPLSWEIQSIKTDGATFKRSTREWVFTEKLTSEINPRKTIIYEVKVPEGESTGFVRFQGKAQGIIPRFESPIDGDTEVELVECLDVPVAITHLDTTKNEIDVTLGNLIEFDQIQAAIAFWLEDVSVPGTCGLTIGFETMKTLIAHWLTDIPVDEPLPGGVAPPGS